MTLLYTITEQPTSRTHAKTSIVLALGGGAPALDEQVATIWSQCRRTGTELVVACAAGASHVAAARTRFPGAHVIGAPVDTPLETLRTLGLEAATGDIVTLLDVRAIEAMRASLPELDLRLGHVS